MSQAAAIVDDIRTNGLHGLQQAIGDMKDRSNDPILIEQSELQAAFKPAESRRTAAIASTHRSESPTLRPHNEPV